MCEVVKQLKIPSTIYKDDCGYCFETMINPNFGDGGPAEPEHQLNICLGCFQSFCHEHVNLHQQVVRRVQQATHDLYLNVYKIERPKATESAEKRLKLEVQDLSEEELYETVWSLVRINNACTARLGSSKQKQKMDTTVVSKLEQIIRTRSSDFKDMAATWQLEIKACPHSEQFVVPQDAMPVRETCGDCDLDRNLWLCLHCGNIGCGREQVGIEGHSHALKHYQQSENNHPLAVKLGSLTSESNDIYCYSCNDEVAFPDPNRFSAVLAKFGIDLEGQVAKEKTLVELQVEQNMNWDFQMRDSGNEFTKKIFASKEYGCGLINLGNSCYLNSVVQVLFNGGVQDWNLDMLGDFPRDVVFPSTNLKCQLIKLRNALKIHPEKYQHGVKPASVKKCIGEDNEEFSSGRQQDAMEFLTYFIDKLDRKVFSKASSSNPNDLMRFMVEDRLECTKCEHVKYSSQVCEILQIPLLDSNDPQFLMDRLHSYFNGESLDIHCPQCSEITVATKNSMLKTAPATLLINPIRIKLQNWTPIKTSNQLFVPGLRDEKRLKLSQFKAHGRQPGEKIFEDSPDDNSNVPASAISFNPDEDKVISIISMGFSKNAALRALYNTGSEVERALNWIFEHMEDPELNAEFSVPGTKKQAAVVDQGALDSMVSMGLAERHCRKALILNDGDVTRSVEWVFNNADNLDDDDTQESIDPPVSRDYGYPGDIPDYALSAVICHKGNSVQSGHYVAFIKKAVDGEPKWVLYNDEKLMAVGGNENLQEIEKNGYIFIFNRIAPA
ncbi:FAGR023Cp [Eremothecium gossypii FDAG1]|nr:FAGR023Cp [Eremothecium gossypii FDAG1]